MSAIEDGILKKFYEDLRTVDSLPPELIEGLSGLFSDGKSPKPDALVDLITSELEPEV